MTYLNIQIENPNILLGVLSVIPIEVVYDVSGNIISVEFNDYIKDAERKLLRKYYKEVCTGEIIFYFPLLLKKIEYKLMFDSSLDTLSIVRHCDLMESETVMLIPSGIS